MTDRVWVRLALPLLASLTMTACSGSGNEPTPVASLVIDAPSPAAGSSIPTTQIGIQWFVARGSGLISIPITVTSDRDVPFATLWVYLGDGPSPNNYCGQNLPDAPTWGPFPKGVPISVTITGFQIGHVPCTVTSLRAYLHTRNILGGGAGTPPIASETIAQSARDVNYTFR